MQGQGSRHQSTVAINTMLAMTPTTITNAARMPVMPAWAWPGVSAIVLPSRGTVWGVGESVIDHNDITFRGADARGAGCGAP